MLVSTITLTDILAIIGALAGTAGMVLGVLNYLRDRPEVRVALIWDMTVTGGPHNPSKRYALVKVANVGRRPVFISHASLKVPKGHAYTDLLLFDSLQGDKLSEGDPPKTYTSNQDNMEQYATDWRKIRAVVRDSAGREYFSPHARRSAKVPSWAGGGK